MTVTKETIIKQIITKTGWSRTDSKKAMQKLLSIMFKALSNGEDILISGFGKFKVLHKNARLGRNPHTMEEIKLKARKVVSFKASETLRRKTNLDGKALEPSPEDSDQKSERPSKTSKPRELTKLEYLTDDDFIDEDALADDEDEDDYDDDEDDDAYDAEESAFDDDLIQTFIDEDED